LKQSTKSENLKQILEGEKPLPVPYRPCGEVPIFIRRNGPQIQPLPIVDGHVQDPLVMPPDTIKAPAKVPSKAASTLSVPAVVKKLANDAVRVRPCKFWK
jgi:hypothetical protein